MKIKKQATNTNPSDWALHIPNTYILYGDVSILAKNVSGLTLLFAARGL